MAATITLASVQTELQLWLDARASAAKGLTISLNGRTLTTQNLAEIDNMINKLSRQEQSLLSRQRTGKRSPLGSLGTFR